MRKVLYGVGIFAVGVMLALVTTTPAMAHVTHVFIGSRGHAWTNSDHTRVGVDDQNCDGKTVWAVVRVDIRGELRDIGGLPDVNGSPTACNDPHTVYTFDPPIIVLAIDVCATGVGCHGWEFV